MSMLVATSDPAGPRLEAHRARRRYSQNFLRDPGTIGRIIDAIAPQPTDDIVEVGPGSGALTAPLLARCERLTAVEIDRDLARMLDQRFGAERLTLICADALKIDWELLARQAAGRLRIVGNLPYHISTPLLFAWLPVAPLVADQHLMLQKEVVERIVAPPGGRDYGRLSVMLQFRYRVERLFNVAPGAFAPAPKVQSSVIRMVPLAPDAMAVADVRAFSRVVTAAFGQRRKTLRNALAAVMNEAAIRNAGVDPGARAETLDIEAFARLAMQAAENPLPRPSPASGRGATDCPSRPESPLSGLPEQGGLEAPLSRLRERGRGRGRAP
jgi:16S rRNA (adenine1518-N6/adenine1519-N6)-dimethyltransferase